MTPSADAKQIEALARELCAKTHQKDYPRPDVYCPLSWQQAQMFAESDWLAAHVAAIAGDGRDLAAEVEHWKAHAEEAGRGFTQVCKDAARMSARNVELNRRIEALADELGSTENCDKSSGWAADRLRALLSDPASEEAS